MENFFARLSFGRLKKDLEHKVIFQHFLKCEQTLTSNEMSKYKKKGCKEHKNNKQKNRMKNKTSKIS